MRLVQQQKHAPGPVVDDELAYRSADAEDLLPAETIRHVIRIGSGAVSNSGPRRTSIRSRSNRSRRMSRLLKR
jgi:hypothetical protein